MTASEPAGHALKWDAPVGPGFAIAEAAIDAEQAHVEPASQPTVTLSSDIDAEQAALGAALIEPDQVMPFYQSMNLQASDFQNITNRKIFTAMLALYRAKQPIDSVIIARETGIDCIVINKKIEACPTWTHAESYVEQILASRARRKLIELATETKQQAEAGAPVADLCTDLITQATDLQVTPSAIQPKPLAELVRHASGEDPNELLRSHYLSRGGSLLLVAQTGVGKSSFVMQAAMTWALCRPFFGITPARSLRTLIFQAENDDGDIADMRDGVLRSMGLTDEQKAIVLRNIDTYFDNSHTSNKFGDVLRGLLVGKSYDLLIVDPASAYHGADSSQQRDVTLFLRNIINPILTEYGCGLILVHHTTKPPKYEKTNWQGGDWAYLGAGSAEWCNWARGVINIEAVGDVYRLRLPKRGRQVGWKTENDGAAIFTRYIAHAREPDQIYWREADPEEIPDPAQEHQGPGRPVTAKPALEAYMPLALEIVKAKPVQVSVFRARIEELILDNSRLGQIRGRALFDLLSKGDSPPLAVTKRRRRLPQFIGLPDAVLKVENDQISMKLEI